MKVYNYINESPDFPTNVRTFDTREKAVKAALQDFAIEIIERMMNEDVESAKDFLDKVEFYQKENAGLSIYDYFDGYEVKYELSNGSAEYEYNSIQECEIE
jgi:hypothetical protein